MISIVLIAGLFTILGLTFLVFVAKVKWWLTPILGIIYVATSLYIFHLETALKGRPIDGLTPHGKYLVVDYAVGNNKIYLWLIDLKAVAAGKVVEPTTYDIPYNKDTDKNLSDSKKQQEKTHVPNIIDMDAQDSSKSGIQSGQEHSGNEQANGGAPGGETGTILNDGNGNGIIKPRPYEPEKDAPKQE